MTDDPTSRKLRDINWKRELTASEQAELDAWLKAHPEARADWETDVALTSSLCRLADAPISSNFTSRVLQAVEREARAEGRGRSVFPWWQNWARRARWVMGTSFTGVILTVGLVAHHHSV